LQKPASHTTSHWINSTMTHRLSEHSQRVLDFNRISDSKVFPAEIRSYPNRFVESLVGQKITVAWNDSEDNFINKVAVLTWDNTSSDPWDWKNDTFECRFVIPEVSQAVDMQSPRSPSPILVKGTQMEVTTQK
jgi:hypothetical protein